MTALQRAESSWPSAVWDVPILRGLDARARTEIAAAGALRRLRAGERVFAPGEPADALFVVESGSVVLEAARRGQDVPSVVRRAGAGDVFGEEAIAARFSTRQLEARCERGATVAVVPLVVLRRAATRAGGAELLAKMERALRRASTLDLLRTASFSRDLAAGDLEVLLDATRHVHLERGEHLYRAADPAHEAFLVVDGLVQSRGRTRIDAYLGRGDVFGHEELAAGAPRARSAVASGPTWLVGIRRDAFLAIARRNARGLERAVQQRSELPEATRFDDLYRLRVARSLLVIDQDSCTRCGHCAWSCADAHDDGISRLVRRGDSIAVASLDASVVPLLVPNACQHCTNPSCMIDCPTGAISRDGRGDVLIREDLCTGCGSCAKACPWDNIQLAPRADASTYPAVAVKCDLCRGKSGGPACVAACPAQAIARIDPSAALLELRPSAEAPVLAPRLAVWPWITGAAIAGVGLALTTIARWTSGIGLGVLLTLLVAYPIAKRVRRPLAALRGRTPLSRLLYIGHLALGVLACGLVASHVGTRIPANAGGALLLALVVAIVTGAAGAVVGVLVPRLVARIERTTILPEELGQHARELDAKIFGSLSGRSELVKTLFVKALGPYQRSRLGPVLLVLAGRTLDEEERAVRGRLDLLTGGKASDALAGIDVLVRLVVEHRAVRAQRLLTFVLRGWLVPHLAASAAVLVLVVMHVIGALRP